MVTLTQNRSLLLSLTLTLGLWIQVGFVLLASLMVVIRKKLPFIEYFFSGTVLGAFRTYYLT